jgi:DNA (cytosine-5)-methyltransferase 1
MASETNVVIEREQAYLRISRRVNQNFAQNVSFFESPAELVSSTQLSARTADLALLSIPCTGHSRSGKSKNKIAMGEAHADAGAQVFYAIDFIQRLNPAIVQIENVPDYIGSASYEILTGVLTHMGYVVQTRVFAGRDFGALENRKRMIMLALSKGIAESTQFDLSSVSGRKTVPATVGAIVDRSAGDTQPVPGW